MPDQAPCGSCGAPVFWLKHHKTTKLAPIDAEPVADGNVVIDLAAGTYQIIPKDLFADPTIQRRHKNHFATCPNAASHHKAKK